MSRGDSNELDSPLSRRAALAGIGTALTGTIATLAFSRRQPDDGPVAVSARIAGGEQGALYLEVAQLLADELERGLVEEASAVVTTGSLANLQLLRSGSADFGLAVANTLLDAPELFAVGRVYQNYLQCVVREDSRFHLATDLVGARISVGPAGSGSNPLNKRTLAALGVAGRDTTTLDMSLVDATAALAAAEIDALMISSGLPVPLITQLAGTVPIRLLDLTNAIPALNRDLGDCFHRAFVNANVYGVSADVAAIAVANILVAGRHVSDALVAGVVDLLLERADVLIGQSVGIQFLSLASLIDTYPARLHPVAADCYRRRYR